MFGCQFKVDRRPVRAQRVEGDQECQQEGERRHHLQHAEDLVE